EPRSPATRAGTGSPVQPGCLPAFAYVVSRLAALAPHHRVAPPASTAEVGVLLVLLFFLLLRLVLKSLLLGAGPDLAEELLVLLGVDRGRATGAVVLREL